jgi:hypothetical protein
MTMIVRCECDAVYARVDVKTGHWVEDSADCEIRGNELDSWRGHTVRSFELMKNPTE